jgi:hypothetical protein
MTSRDDDFNPRPGRIHHGNQGDKRQKSFVGEVMRAAKKAGHRGQTFKRSGGSGRRSTFGRGRRAALSLGSRSSSRRVVVMARIVRHRGGRFRSAPLTKHLAYLKREGVTRDGADARMFDTASDDADTTAFAERCEQDRHHFRFTVSPEDAGQLADLRAFTQEACSTDPIAGAWSRSYLLSPIVASMNSIVLARPFNAASRVASGVAPM